MERLLILTIFVLTTVLSFAQYSDPNFSKPASGYGADGSHVVATVSFTNPRFLTKKIEVYYPQDISEPVPTIFYSHAYGGNNSDNISGMLNYVASIGYAIVYVPYQTTGVTVDERYSNLLNGFRMAARLYKNIIDTTRVGFIGHSFGGGASFGTALTAFTENNWGSNGRFIYALAQWYAYNLSDDDLTKFPTDTRVLVEVFDDDVTNDHRMAIDVFKRINIADNEKDYVMVKSSTVNGYTYSAEHNLPNTSAAFDALDYYAYYRFIDALCDYTFNGSAAGKEVALGNGSAAQVAMPTGMTPLVETDSPTALYPQSKYLFPCGSTENPRSLHCSDTGTAVKNTTGSGNTLQVYTNADDKTTLSIPVDAVGYPIYIYNQSGNIVRIFETNGQAQVDLNLAPLSKGVYLIRVDRYRTKMIR